LDTALVLQATPILCPLFVSRQAARPIDILEFYDGRENMDHGEFDMVTSEHSSSGNLAMSRL